MTRKFYNAMFSFELKSEKMKTKSNVCRNASPTNDNDNSSESDNSDGSSSGDSSSDENQKNESVTDWSLMAFVKRDVQPKVDPLPSLPVPEVKPEPDVKSSSTTRAGADSKKFLSPMCLNNEQIKQEPIGKFFVCQQKKKPVAP